MFKKGFTLIELLIVIAIIGILSVALVPTGMNALKKARDGTRVANLGTIKTAMMQYVLDNSICPSEATGASTDALIAAELNTYFDANTPKDPSGNKH
ncbi:prepilin-type N-terminal cleavage/methylation domain-containing protein, partial [Patescibacteria group bacterium]|nr:prepilin-type N-terminal cleavage/methylation domain-containing protein [Patescibacteria group bacterium]